MHILMTANAAWSIWNFRRPLVGALMGDGHRITALAPPYGSVPALEGLGCRVLPLAMRAKGLNPLADLALQRRLARHFRAERPDAILSYTIKNNVFGARAATAAGIPLLPNVTGLGTAFLSGRLLQGIAEHLYRGAFAALPVVFFQNADDRDLFLDRRLVRAGQARLLPGSGIDLDHFAPAPMPETPPVFLMVARLLRDKGVVEFVAAARRVRARHPGVRFRLLGAVGSENRSAIDAATLQGWVAEGAVEYLGTTDDVRPAIAAAACVVLPSYREGALRMLIEAAAMARPVIATDVPGCRAVVDREVSGFLCEVRSADSLAAAIERFLALAPGARAAIGGGRPGEDDARVRSGAGGGGLSRGPGRDHPPRSACPRIACSAAFSSGLRATVHLLRLAVLRVKTRGPAARCSRRKRNRAEGLRTRVSTCSTSSYRPGPSPSVAATISSASQAVALRRKTDRAGCRASARSRASSAASGSGLWGASDCILAGSCAAGSSPLRLESVVGRAVAAVVAFYQDFSKTCLCLLRQYTKVPSRV